MAISSILTEYAGARATKYPVDREEILDEIRAAIQGTGTRVIYLIGVGGIGKTYLLRTVLRYCQPGGEWYTEGLLAPPPDDLVDLYHTFLHTRPQLASALKERLQVPEGAFQKFDETYKDWERKRYDLAGMLRELSGLRDEVGEAFCEDWNRLAQGHRLVIALDTAERLLYEEDEVQRRLGLEPERVDSLDWLLKILPCLENTVVLIAGRPRPERLRHDLGQVLGDRLIVRDLDRFGLEDTQKYFDAVADAVRQDGLEEQAARIERIPSDVREVIWYYTGGRPILLALMIDYLVVTDELPPQVKEPVEVVRQRSPHELEQDQEEIEASLVRFWQETGRQVDQAILALAWARKGMDAELLARVADLKRDDGKWDVDLAREWLTGIRDLSFVKSRSADERAFLHDEMYTLLKKHLLDALPDAQRDRTLGAILEYYRDRILAQRERVAELWIPRKQGTPEGEETSFGQPRSPDQPAELARATVELYNLMAEEVHYRLRRDPTDGFQTYKLYAKEAFWASEESLDHLLRSEMLLFLDEHRGEDVFDGLHRSEVEVDLALRRLERYNRRRDRRAPGYGQDIRERCADLLEEAGPLTHIRLDVLEGEALVYLGTDLTGAEKLLTCGIDELRKFAARRPLDEWERPILLAEALNDLGYLYRNRGWYRGAAKQYGEAVDMWRNLVESEEDKLRCMAMQGQHANVLNNQALVLAELGRFGQATHLCEDALEMRQSLGPGAPVAFSLNTLGLILTRDDKPNRARPLCERAKSILRSLDQPRGVGLASIALAEAYRRISAIPRLRAPEENADLLRGVREQQRAGAIQHVMEAVEIFAENGPVPERTRLVEALIERGCVYRQWAWLRPQYESAEDPDQDELARRSEDDLRKAMALAGDDLRYHRLDAHVNLAWLYYYVRRNDDAGKEARKAIASVPAKYRFKKKRQPPAKDLPYTFYWPLLGKAHLLLGQLAMRRFLEMRRRGEPGDPEALRQAGEFYTLSLAYDELFAPDFRDVRRGRGVIYERLRGLNAEEFGWVHKGIAEAVEKYCLSEPTRLDDLLEEYNLRKRL